MDAALSATGPRPPPLSDGHVLGDYVFVLGRADGRPGDPNDVGGQGVAQVKVPGIVKIASRPVPAGPRRRPGQPDEVSVVSATIGALSCRAEDHSVRAEARARRGAPAP